jgi:hypothetical protein
VKAHLLIVASAWQVCEPAVTIVVAGDVSRLLVFLCRAVFALSVVVINSPMA